jgi:hypothetical protein
MITSYTDLDFTFGIITAGGNEALINTIIDSIELQNIPNYEIIIVGSCAIERSHLKVIPFDETVRKAWITKKKNLITANASYENIVFLHDYIKLEPGWYNGQVISGNDFQIRMDKIINYDGTRFRDWCIWPHNSNLMDQVIGRNCLIPYNITHLSKYMYISGSYWIAKKDVMLEYPLDENRAWGEGEDVEWSKIVRQKYSFDMNTNSAVKIMKPNKDRVFNEPDEITIQIISQMK